MTSLALHKKALDDVVGAAEHWRIGWLLGIGDIRQRYSRSRLGQFWITASMAFFILAIGSVWGLLFDQQLDQFLPYISANYIVWILIAGFITDSVSVFTGAESYLRQMALPKTVFIMRMVVRGLMNFAHNVVIVPIALVAAGTPLRWTWLLVPVGILLVVLAAFCFALLVGVLATRFRDLPQVVQNLIQVAFFTTPVMWPADVLRQRFPAIIDYNPFAAFLHVVSQPMLGIVPSWSTYGLALISIFFLAIAGWFLFVRFRSRLVYWL
ncbi:MULTISPECIES: ABC transporter permease [unclassified Aureimonas]|uniref:ABC transporter permease n=1 Tax=unclassified Aureimonas TaxID=2615206 RepID=UPI0006F3994C|nr:MULTISPECIES: ABC transporter permease [unclassified Aureimonas]KQT56280.1 ABC transporter [Aureimonas sp. Leaf427]KQT65888.1 ABC transporter [Aureimonas sp. Leaf460]